MEIIIPKQNALSLISDSVVLPGGAQEFVFHADILPTLSRVSFTLERERDGEWKHVVTAICNDGLPNSRPMDDWEGVGIGGDLGGMVLRVRVVADAKMDLGGKIVTK